MADASARTSATVSSTITVGGPRALATAVALSLGALGLHAPESDAGTAVVKSTDGGATRFEYNDTMLRIGTEDDSSGYAVIREGSMYAVVNEGGNPMVIDAGSMMKNFANVAPQAVQTDIRGRVIKFEGTGKSETVAGIKGEVYEVQFEDESGKVQSGEMVLSSDPRAREFRDALFLMMGVATQLASPDAAQATDDMQKRLRDKNLGVLRYGDDFTVSSIDSGAVDDARFALPAEPMNLDGLGAMLGGMTSQSGADTNGADAGTTNEKKGGLFSTMMGALGDKTDRQGDRVGDSVEREIDQETDEKVDNAIGKAFGKLFGR